MAAGDFLGSYGHAAAVWPGVFGVFHFELIVSAFNATCLSMKWQGRQNVGRVYIWT